MTNTFQRWRNVALLGLVPLTANIAVGIAAENLKEPEIVRFQTVRTDKGSKFVTVGNAKGSYKLSCNLKVTGCITPGSAKDYYVFKKGTRWRMPGAKVDIDLTFVQDWIGAYKNSENIGLVPKDGGGPETLGIFTLGSWTKK